MMEQRTEPSATRRALHRTRERTRPRPTRESISNVRVEARALRIIVLCAMLTYSSRIEAFTPSLHAPTRSTDGLRTVPPNSRSQRPKHQRPPTRSQRRHRSDATPTSLAAAAAASAWLFTPDRTSSLLADTASEAIVSTANAATDAALEVAAHAVDIAAAVSTDTVVQTIYKAPFLSLAISFLLGGLFFSTVAAGVAAVVALGKENTRRLREVMLIVARRNWSVMKLSMQLTMDVLRGKEQMSGFKNRFPAALQTLKDGVAEVRRVFTESVDAIKKETQMYSAAVGLPGLIPIQYIFDRIFLSTLTAPFQGALEDALAQTARDNPQIRSLKLKRFSMGDLPPKVLEARLYDLGNRDMAFDLEMLWKSNAKAELEIKVTSFGAKIPVTISNLKFEGPVRLILTGLMAEEPGWTALLISLPRPPRIGFDIKVAGGLITQIPWLRNEVARMLDGAVAEEVLWPRRAVVSAPSPYKAKPLLNPMQILGLMRDDPLLRMERDLMASIPDDFRTTLEASDREDIPDFDIRQVGDAKEGSDGDGINGDGDGEGTMAALPKRKRLRFWQRNRQAATVEAATEDTLQLMAQSLQQETTHLGESIGMPVMVLEGVEEKKSLARRMFSVILLPKSLLAFAGREGGFS